jgi:leucyl aminopeptidase (aminopeptidase T)
MNTIDMAAYAVSSWALHRAAIKLFRDNIRLRRRERVAVVTDRENDPIFAALMQACRELGGVPLTVRITPDREHSSPIPRTVAVFNKSNVIVAATDKSITHSPETVAARKRGARVVSMPTITPEMFVKAMRADYEQVKRITAGLARKLEGSREIAVTTPSGTSVVLSVEGRVFEADDGDVSKKGLCTNIPAGEIFAAPLETGARGVIAIDYFKKMLSPKQKAKLSLDKGRIVDCNSAAKPFVKMLGKAGKCGFVIAELGLGTNPEHRKPVGNVLFDEKIFGSAHIAFGENRSMGGRNACPIHADVVMMKPTIVVDGRVAMRKGKLV